MSERRNPYLLVDLTIAVGSISLRARPTTSVKQNCGVLNTVFETSPGTENRRLEPNIFFFAEVLLIISRLILANREMLGFDALKDLFSSLVLCAPGCIFQFVKNSPLS